MDPWGWYTMIKDYGQLDTVQWSADMNLYK